MNFTFFVEGGLHNKVRAIKGLRKLSGLGLKEAKDFVEGVESKDQPVVAQFTPAVEGFDLQDAINMLAEGGVRVTRMSGEREDVLGKINAAAVDAVKATEYELAEQLIEVLKNNRV
jgi:succinyl-CoA synthetase alpha subunit